VNLKNVNSVIFAIDIFNGEMYFSCIMSEFAREIGLELVENSRLAEEFSAQHGLINELFPYVYEASKRMSSRAISRWLESKGTKLSAATIAKALRNPKLYWEELAEEIEPNSYDLLVEELLLKPELFLHFKDQPPGIARVTQHGVIDSHNEIQGAITKLNDWFKLPETAREECLAHAGLDFQAAIERAKKKGEEKHE